MKEIKRQLVGVLIKCYVKIETAAVLTEIEQYSKVPEEDYEPPLFWRCVIRFLNLLALRLERILNRYGITNDFLKWEVYDNFEIEEQGDIYE